MTKTTVTVGLGSCGIAAGAGKTYQKIKSLQETENMDFELRKTSCIGMCYREPLVEIVDETGIYIYGDINEERAIEVIEKHINQHDPIREYIVYTDLFDAPENYFIESQVKIVLRNCGYIDPESIEEYEAREGYNAIRRIAERKISCEEVIQDVLDSGLRGRGGGGFPTGMKWKFAYAKIEKDTVIAWSPDVPKPIAVRYAWASNPTCNLSNGSGLPAAPFRTDDFPFQTKNRKY